MRLRTWRGGLCSVKGPCLKPPESPPESGDNYHVTNLWLQPQQF